LPITPGTRLGPYEIQALLGAGGMGEVYRARDSKLKREVAIKVLPEAFAQGPERLVRFELFEQHYAFGAGITIANYDVSRDGKRFLMVKDEAGAGRLNVVLNAFRELE
jgi:serine/threonine protein kinase